jgi:hypothetical protein
VVAVGDVHGNYPGFRRILEETGLIGGDGRWQARDTHLVQMGDVLGRGGEPGKIFSLLRRLEAEAPAYGSRVHFLLGNHEAMSIRGVIRYNTPEEFRDLSACGFGETDGISGSAPGPAAARERGAQGARGPSAMAIGPAPADGGAGEPASWTPVSDPKAKLERRLDLMGALAFHAAVSPQGTLGAWLADHDSAVAINGHLFVHGGLNRAHGLMPLPEINVRVRAGLFRPGDGGERVFDRDGPQWDRDYLLRPGPGKSEELGEVLDYHGCRRMVVGHTPTRCLGPECQGRIASLYDGRLYGIDTGIGLAYGGRLGALAIEDGEPRPLLFA